MNRHHYHHLSINTDIYNNNHQQIWWRARRSICCGVRHMKEASAESHSMRRMEDTTSALSQHCTFSARYLRSLVHHSSIIVILMPHVHRHHHIHHHVYHHYHHHVSLLSLSSSSLRIIFDRLSCAILELKSTG